MNAALVVQPHKQVNSSSKRRVSLAEQKFHDHERGGNKNDDDDDDAGGVEKQLRSRKVSS